MPAPKKTAAKKAREVRITPTSVLAVLFVIAVAFYAVKYVQQPAVQPSTTTTIESGVLQYADLGDAVSIDYTGRYAKNKSVFDTSLAEVAQEAGIYDAQGAYKPITVIVGQGQLIPGFENALIGMKVGEIKSITVQPEEAYGEYDPTKIVYVNRTQRIPRFIPVERQDFVSAFNEEPVVGESYTAADSLWPLKVLNASNDTVYAEQEATPGTTIEGMFGAADVVGVTEDSVLVKENPTSGQTVYSAYGPARVLRYNDTEIVVDLNHPLAGETLEFTIKMQKLMKQ